MIIADKVERTFKKGQLRVLNPVSFCIKQGESVGIIGKNGVGKTTLLKLIAGVLKPTEGTVWTMDKEAYEALDTNKKHMGYLFAGNSQLAAGKTLQESLEFQRKAYKISKEQYEEIFEQVGKRLKIHEFYKRPKGQLSIGQRRCGEFFAAVLHRPKLLLLDEPTIGLDKENRSFLNEIVRFLQKKYQMTVITCSHDMSSLEKTCDRVLVLQDSNLAFDGPWDVLKKQADVWKKVSFVSDMPIDLEDLPIKYVKYENGRTELMFQQNRISVKTLEEYLVARSRIQQFQVSEPEIESVICHVLKRGVM